MPVVEQNNFDIALLCYIRYMLVVFPGNARNFTNELF